MKPTEEQNLIIGTDENLRINARAGTGKTTTLYHYIKNRRENSRVLYIAFNKSVQEEAEKKFKDIDHLFLHIRTAHSMAFEAIVKKERYEVGFLNPEDVSKYLKIDDFVMCTHVMKMVNYWCGCVEEKVQDIDYRSVVSNAQALSYVEDNYDKIVLNTRKILAKMNNKEIPITHDFYLKKWQLSNPVLKYDYILFDEGQDASETMLEVFNKQKGIKIIVGDSHQQIYSWRNAVNSLDKVDFRELELSKSFRFDQGIADLAIKSIKWKMDFFKDPTLAKFSIIGAGVNKTIKTKAYIGRTNVGLLAEALNQVVILKKVKRPYFESGFSSYSIGNIAMIAKDIIAIFKGETEKIKTPKIRKIKDKEDLKKFINETEDVALSQAVAMVEKYGKELIPFIKTLKEKLVENKEDADTIFTTVHKSKGMEYDHVVMIDDFNGIKQMMKIIGRSGTKFRENALKLVNEEINLVYVGITRTKGTLVLPDSIKEDLNIL